VSEYLRPKTLDEAVALRAAHPDWIVLAGGTDLMVNANHRPAPLGILDLWALDELRGIREDAGRLTIGAATPWLDVVEDRRVARHAPILASAAREIGALQIQARGTIGGNIGTSSPVGDSLPVLLALDAELELRSPRGARTVAYRDFCTGYRKTLLAADELIASVTIPAQHAGARQLWRKVGTRRAQSISKVMAAAVLRVEDGRFVEARIGLGAVADRPIRATAVEQVLLGAAPGEPTAAAAAAALAGAVKPITDVRSSSAYRLQVVQNVIKRFVLVAAVVALMPGCGSGCSDPPAPSSETCQPTGAQGAITRVELGRDFGDTFMVYQEGSVVPLTEGGQGFPMLVLNLRVTGSQVPPCLPQHTRVFHLDGAVEAEELGALRAREVAPDTWITGDMFLVSFGVSGGQMVRLDTQVGDATASAQVWVDYELSPDAGVFPDAL
jgi:CO/xanthine dehydrogenase FAD-binding subunit